MSYYYLSFFSVFDKTYSMYVIEFMCVCVGRAGAKVRVNIINCCYFKVFFETEPPAFLAIIFYLLSVIICFSYYRKFRGEG